MEQEKALPDELARLAERGTWFSRENTGDVLAWLETHNLPLDGIEAARKLPDGQWMLLIDPMLDFNNDADQAKSVQQGREFIRDHSDADLMFELRLPGY